MGKNLNNRLLNIGGVYHTAFALFHCLFWKLQNWEVALKSLTVLDQQIMQILNLCLILVFVGFAWISLAHKSELIKSKLGRTFLLFVGSFWLFRLVLHFFFSGLVLDSIPFSLIFIPGFAIYFYLGSIGNRN